MPRVRRRVHFSGRVQGVGFRFTCQSLARGYEVAGLRAKPGLTAGSSSWRRANRSSWTNSWRQSSSRWARYIRDVDSGNRIAWLRAAGWILDSPLIDSLNRTEPAYRCLAGTAIRFRSSSSYFSFIRTRSASP